MKPTAACKNRHTHLCHRAMFEIAVITTPRRRSEAQRELGRGCAHVRRPEFKQERLMLAPDNPAQITPPTHCAGAMSGS
jgi:hypothetical protein